MRCSQQFSFAFDKGFSFENRRRALSVIASAPSVKRGDPHPVSALISATPSTAAVLARVVEESAAGGIGTLLHAGRIATTEQGSSGFADWNEQLSRLLEIRLKSSLEALHSLDQSRGARWAANHVVAAAPSRPTPASNRAGIGPVTTLPDWQPHISRASAQVFQDGVCKVSDMIGPLYRGEGIDFLGH